MSFVSIFLKEGEKLHEVNVENSITPREFQEYIQFKYGVPILDQLVFWKEEKLHSCCKKLSDHGITEGSVLDFCVEPASICFRIEFGGEVYPIYSGICTLINDWCQELLQRLSKKSGFKRQANETISLFYKGIMLKDDVQACYYRFVEMDSVELQSSLVKYSGVDSNGQSRYMPCNSSIVAIELRYKETEKDVFFYQLPSVPSSAEKGVISSAVHASSISVVEDRVCLDSIRNALSDLYQISSEMINMQVLNPYQKSHDDDSLLIQNDGHYSISVDLRIPILITSADGKCDTTSMDKAMQYPLKREISNGSVVILDFSFDVIIKDVLSRLNRFLQRSDDHPWFIYRKYDCCGKENEELVHFTQSSNVFLRNVLHKCMHLRAQEGTRVALRNICTTATRQSAIVDGMRVFNLNNAIFGEEEYDFSTDVQESSEDLSVTTMDEISTNNRLHSTQALFVSSKGELLHDYSDVHPILNSRHDPCIIYYFLTFFGLSELCRLVNISLVSDESDIQTSSCVLSFDRPMDFDSNALYDCRFSEVVFTYGVKSPLCFFTELFSLMYNSNSLNVNELSISQKNIQRITISEQENSFIGIIERSSIFEFHVDALFSFDRITIPYNMIQEGFSEVISLLYGINNYPFKITVNFELSEDILRLNGSVIKSLSRCNPRIITQINGCSMDGSEGICQVEKPCSPSQEILQSCMVKDSLDPSMSCGEGSAPIENPTDNHRTSENENYNIPKVVNGIMEAEKADFDDENEHLGNSELQYSEIAAFVLKMNDYVDMDCARSFTMKPEQIEVDTESFSWVRQSSENWPLLMSKIRNGECDGSVHLVFDGINIDEQNAEELCQVLKEGHWCTLKSVLLFNGVYASLVFRLMDLSIPLISLTCLNATLSDRDLTSLSQCVERQQLPLSLCFLVIRDIHGVSDIVYHELRDRLLLVKSNEQRTVFYDI